MSNPFENDSISERKVFWKNYGHLPPSGHFCPGIKGSSLRDEYPVDPENLWSVARAALKTV
jgi:hypothetical protein